VIEVTSITIPLNVLLEHKRISGVKDPIKSLIFALTFASLGFALKCLGLNVWPLPFIHAILAFKMQDPLVCILYLAILTPIICLDEALTDAFLLLTSLALTLLIYNLILETGMKRYFEAVMKETLDRIDCELRGIIVRWRLCLLILPIEASCILFLMGISGAVLYVFYRSAALYMIQADQLDGCDSASSSGVISDLRSHEAPSIPNSRLGSLNIATRRVNPNNFYGQLPHGKIIDELDTGRLGLL